MVRKLLKAKERPHSMMLLATLLLTIAGSLPSNAREFQYTYEGQTFKYTVLDEAAKTVETKAGMGWTSPGNYAYGNLILPEHPISEGVEYTLIRLGDNAFSGQQLTSVEIPNSVISIGSSAFSMCPGLTSVVFGNSVTSIGSEAFTDCGKLTSVVFGKSVNSIGSSAFYGCGALTSVEIPNSVNSIGSEAFRACSGLTSVVIGNSVNSIGSSAFYGCKALTSIEIPNSVISIGSSAFYECRALTSVVIGSSVKSIGDGAFYSCSSLDSVVIPNSVNEIGNYAFYNTRLTSVVIGNSVNSIGDSAFKCPLLTSVVIPNSVNSIGKKAFSGCALTDVVLPPSVTSIGDNAFASNKLKTISIGYGIYEIGEKAFDQNNDIEIVSITAVNPPHASNNTFPSYEMPLWLISQEAFDNYIRYPRCWYFFDGNMHTLVPINSLSAEKIEVSGLPGETIKLDVKIEPENASLQQLFWRSTRPDLISVDNEGNVTFMGEASSLTRSEEECQIIVTTMYESTPALTFDFKVTASGIEQIFGEEEFDSVKADRPNDIYTLQGSCVKRNASQEDIDALAPGLYIIAGKKVLVK